MDENSREGETSENAENLANNQRAKEMEDGVPELENVGIKIEPVSELQDIQVAGRAEPSADISGASSNTFLPSLKKESDKKKILRVVEDDDDDEDDALDPCPTVISNNSDAMPREGHQQQFRLPPAVEQPMSPIIPIMGPPPSYSFVMNQKAKFFKSRRSITPISERLPPPTYSGMQRLYLPPDETQGDRFCALPSFSEPMWRSHSQPALCPRCGIIILTSTHSHHSVATHVAALALCLLGCWPCCLIPYCINGCKNIHHHCPICQTFLGSYVPW